MPAPVNCAANNLNANGILQALGSLLENVILRTTTAAARVSEFLTAAVSQSASLMHKQSPPRAAAVRRASGDGYRCLARLSKIKKTKTSGVRQRQSRKSVEQVSAAPAKLPQHALQTNYT